MSNDHDNAAAPTASVVGDGFGPTSRRRSTGGVVVLAAVVAAGVALAGVALGHSQSSSKATISVIGSGTVQGTPDTMSFQIGVQNVAQSASSALTENNARVGALEKTLIAHGVAKKDLQTSGLNIYQNTNNAGVVTGFSAVDDLNVTLHQLKNAGAVIDAAANVAGNGVQLYGVSFSISNNSKLLAAARAKAMHNAYNAASQVARGGNTSLGSIVRITDQENATPPPVYYPFAAANAAKSSGVPIQAGSQSINVQVTVVYALNS